MALSATLKAELVKKFGNLTNARKHFRLKWLKALESGRYKQAQDALRELRKDGKSYGYCCLGVLCNLAQQDGVGEWKKEGGTARTFKLENYEDAGSLPVPLAQVMGMSDELQNRLVEMNDTEGKTFKEIATYLRKVWRKR